MNQQAYLEIDKDMDEQSNKTMLDARITDFWLNVIPSLLSNETETEPETTDQCVTSDFHPVLPCITFMIGLVIACSTSKV